MIFSKNVFPAEANSFILSTGITSYYRTKNGRTKQAAFNPIQPSPSQHSQPVSARSLLVAIVVVVVASLAGEQVDIPAVAEPIPGAGG